MHVCLRDYDINPGPRPEFLESWWTRVLRLRERCYRTEPRKKMWAVELAIKVVEIA